MDALQWRKMLKEKIKQITNTKQFHMCMVLVIIVAIIFVAGVISLRYNVEGEGTPPFTISKVSIISSVDGTDVEGSEEKWNLKVNQNNDIYLYIKKNEDYKYTETIADIKLENFNITQSPKVGQIKLLKPDADAENVIFRNSTENVDSNKSYKANMSLELPVGNVVDDGIQSQENTDFKNLVFKRM